MTVISPNSISGITSLTCTSDSLAIHDSSGVIIQNLVSGGITTVTGFSASGVSTLTGGVNVGTAATIYANGNATFSGIVTVSTIGNATDTLTIPGNLTVQGTRTIINTDELNVRDKLVGIGSTASPSTLSQDNAGLVIYGQKNVDFKYEVKKAAVGLNTALCVAGVVTAMSGLNVDVAAGQGINVGSAVSIHANGNLGITGIMTASSFRGDGSNLTGISVGLETGTHTTTNGVCTLDLSKQDHHVILAGISTISCQNGTAGDSHTVRIVNSGITTVGFSTYFLWPSGGVPSIPTTSGTISLISFTVHHVAGIGTQLLAGASLDYS